MVSISRYHEHHWPSFYEVVSVWRHIFPVIEINLLADVYRWHPTPQENLSLLHVLCLRQPLCIILDFFRPSAPALRTGCSEESAVLCFSSARVHIFPALSVLLFHHSFDSMLGIMSREPQTPRKQLKCQKTQEVNKFRACSWVISARNYFQKSTGSLHCRAFHT